jgi:phosphatidylglycerophosphate synthase
MKHSLPFAFTTFRLLLGPVALACALLQAPRLVYLPLLVLSTASDILDGVLARRFAVSTRFLRRYDSIADVIYHAFLLLVLWILCGPVLAKSYRAILVLLISEAACVAVSAVRFRRYPATHSYLAKAYGLCLLASLIALIVFNASGWVLFLLATVAVITNAEIIAIHLVVETPPVDVPTIFTLLRRATHPNATFD